LPKCCVLKRFRRLLPDAPASRTHQSPTPATNAGTTSPAQLLSTIDGHVAAGRKVLVHCWGGGGRTGLVQAAWLAHAKGLSAGDAAAAVLAHAEKLGVPRRVDVAALEAFLAEAKQ